MKKYIIYLNNELYGRGFVYAENEREICKNLAEMINENSSNSCDLILSGIDFVLGIRTPDQTLQDDFIEKYGTHYNLDSREFIESEIYKEICNKNYNYYAIETLTNFLEEI